MVCCDCDTAIYWLGAAVFEWEQLKGDHSTFRSVHTDGDWLWALGQDGRLYSYHYRRRSWLSTSSAPQLRDVAISKDGTLWGINYDGGLQQGYTQLMRGATGASASPMLKNLSTTNQTDCHAVLCTDEGLNLKLYVPGEKKWCEISGQKVGPISVSADGKQIWGIDSRSGCIFYCRLTESIDYMAGSYESYELKWDSVGGSLRQVCVSGDGCHVWGLNHDSQIYYRHGFEGQWVRIAGALQDLCVSMRGETIWGIDLWGNPWICFLDMANVGWHSTQW